MTLIAPRVGISSRPCYVVVEQPTTAPDGGGGYREVWDPVAALYANVAPATAQDAQRFGANTVTSAMSHVVTGPYVAGVTTRCRLRYVDPDLGERTFRVVGVSSPEERRADVIIAAVEQTL
jgi:head-tail adaptor